MSVNLLIVAFVVHVGPVLMLVQEARTRRWHRLRRRRGTFGLRAGEPFAVPGGRLLDPAGELRQVITEGLSLDPEHMRAQNAARDALFVAAMTRDDPVGLLRALPPD